MTEQQAAPRQIVHLRHRNIAGLGMEPVFFEHVFCGSGAERPPKTVCPECGARRSFHYEGTIRWNHGRALDVFDCDSCGHKVTRSTRCAAWSPFTGLEVTR